MSGGECPTFSAVRVLSANPTSVCASDNEDLITFNTSDNGCVSKSSDQHIVVSGQRVSISGQRVKISGQWVSIGGQRVNISGQRVSTTEYCRDSDTHKRQTITEFYTCRKQTLNLIHLVFK